ncbi:phenylalanine--tRNA ligase beta subunit-related protein [Siminovitchia fortis]|uniref:B3/B4 domain-containing protein n=1 Tax=Siminovitchia fortis TaxID=254758 RepID=UPI001ABF7540|nr:phenylalanine--tRNA ligase beta subunit-related protein [Siminovitchia fortis]WHY80337.1 phenylalanine--tRNA ligase beta subunit-related protein [Siminovitchia fortis]
MEVHIDPSLYEVIPYLKIGVIHYDNITVGDSPQMLKGRLQLFQENAYFELEDKNVTDYEEIKEWRAIFKKLGKDPNRYRHSAEALYRRVKKQNYLPPLNSATDLNNFFSLQYKIPLGIYDKDQIRGDVELRKGRAEEQYEGLNGRKNNAENLLVTADDEGPFGSPFVDSSRTAVTPKTTNALQIVYLSPKIELHNAQKLVESLASMFTHINGGKARNDILAQTN